MQDHRPQVGDVMGTPHSRVEVRGASPRAAPVDFLCDGAGGGTGRGHCAYLLNVAGEVPAIARRWVCHCGQHHRRLAFRRFRAGAPGT